MSRYRAVYHEFEDGKLKPADGQPQSEQLDQAAEQMGRVLKRMLPGVVVQSLCFEAEEASTNVNITMHLDARWLSVQEVDETTRVLTRQELIMLLQRAEVSIGTTRLRLRGEDGDWIDDIKQSEAQAALDVITDDVPGQYLKGWGPRDPLRGPKREPPVLPEAGTSAWLGYVMGNRDRIRVGTVATPEDVARGGLGQTQYLDELDWEEQCERMVHWAKEGRTPHVERPSGLERATCETCGGNGKLDAPRLSGAIPCGQCNGHGACYRRKEIKR